MMEDEIATDTGKPTLSLAPSSPTAIQPVSEIVAPADIDQLASAFKKFEEFKRRLLNKGDSIDIRGKIFLKKSAWRKWALACGVSDDLVNVERTPLQGKDADESFSYRIVVRAFHVPSGRSSVGVAIASLSEKDAWAHPEHDVFSLCHTRAKNRAIADLVGGGEVSAEEMTGDPDPGPTTNRGSDIDSLSVAQSEPSQERPPNAETGQIVTEYPLIYAGRTVGAAKVDRKQDHITFVPDKAVKSDSGPIVNFLVPRVLEASKKKHAEFDYILKVNNGLLETVVVKPLPAPDTLDDLLGAVAWAFSKASESKQ
jgi:hypothetical protein